MKSRLICVFCIGIFMSTALAVSHATVVTDTDDGDCNPAHGGNACGYILDTPAGEMTQRFNFTPGDNADFDIPVRASQSGWGLGDAEPFSNDQPGDHWSGTVFPPIPADAWTSGLHRGLPGVNGEWSIPPPWSVHRCHGGTAPVPLPAAVWLFGSGLLGLMGVSLRHRAALGRGASDRPHER